MKKISTLLFAAFLLLSHALTVQAVDALSPQQAATLTAEHKAVIVDVREDDEWQAQHIDGAIHLPLGQLNSRLKELEVYKNTTVIMQCRSGKRSAQAVDVLKAAGFPQVYNLEGGLLAWQKSGLTTKQPCKGMSHEC
jgi:rhodanese-related sulfurtransferase